MTKHWKSITGYFTFPDFYDYVAEQSENDGNAWHGVEVGVYTGQSAAYLIERIVAHFGDKGGIGLHRLDLVDIEMTKHNTRANLAGLPLANVFHELDSVAASALYEDASLDFVFIDAEHDYANVRRDIDAWLPKVRKGGIISGHDLCPDFPGVLQAVSETFPRFEVWRGMRGPGWGDKRMQETGQYYACWAARV